ncbi:YqjF family protein [Streptomyces himalayensis]|uniref:DUF2071 domain-containing protein n=1 Tax=Streptomyces himalayensis subsp. himalayensis TaxID=2756131 RepID=A0A7W0DN28_9ACTN|nr:DUF2071 domain-containing protein [Streptomyces himalayensis]MBA2947364.1 DUF2071 domain-containing protein [Streptomyces himalayensis subsp. himalayensis]
MVSTGPDHRLRLPVLRAVLLTQTFVHWQYPPDEVQKLLPDGLVVDQRDGAAWVSLTPFLMAGVRPPGLPVVPTLDAFPATNLRTYVRWPGGRDGVWFLSSEVGSAVMLAARAVGAPYHLSDLSVTTVDDTVSYAGTRRGGSPSYHLVARPGPRITPSERDIWLCGRWRAFTWRLGTVFEIPIWHDPWVLSSAALEDLGEDLTSAAGLSRPRGEPLVHFSHAMRNVRLGPARPSRLQDLLNLIPGT